MGHQFTDMKVWHHISQWLMSIKGVGPENGVAVPASIGEPNENR